MSYTGMDFFVHTFFPTAITILGTIGNTLGLVLLSTKSMHKFSMATAYKYLLASDAIYLITQLPLLNLMLSYPQIDPVSKSVWFCKLYNYFDYALAQLSPMLLVYISVERLVSIKYPAKRFFLKKHKNICIYTVLVTIFNLVYYIEVALYHDLHVQYQNTTVDNQTVFGDETTTVCTMKNTEEVETVAHMFMVEYTLVPYVLMVACTILMCYTIYSSRRTFNTGNHIRKDLKFTVTSISLNLVFILCSLPISLANFFTSYMTGMLFVFTDYLFFASYGVNFYLFLVFNSLIRREFFSMFYRTSLRVSQTSKNLVTWT